MNQIQEDAGNGARSLVDWPAIFAGAAIATGSTFVFTGFTAAIGLGSVSAESAEGLGLFAIILIGLFSFLSMVAVYALGGYVSGRMRRRSSASEDEVEGRDGIHGLTVWAIGMILTGIVAAGAVSSGARAVGQAASTAVETAGSAVGGAAQGAGQLAGGIVGGVGQAAGGAISGVGQMVGGAAGAVGQASESGQMDYVTDRLLRSEASTPDQFSDDAIRREVTGIMSSLLRTGEAPEEDLDYLRDALAARTDLTPAQIDSRVEQAVTQVQDLRAEAEARVEDARAKAEKALADAEAQAKDLRAQAEERLEQAKEQAIEAAESARHAAVWSALFLTVSSLIAGIAAFMGAVKGGHDRDAGRIWAGLMPRRR